MPAPFAMPPTVKPGPWATATLGPESVVRIASAAAPPPDGESASDAARRPTSTRSSGIRTPITPVERTSTSSGESASSFAAPSAIASASASPSAPVAAFAEPELITTACGSASSRCRLETTTGAACTRFAVHMAAPTEREIERTSARSGLPDGFSRAPARGGDRHGSAPGNPWGCTCGVWTPYDPG